MIGGETERLRPCRFILNKRAELSERTESRVMADSRRVEMIWRFGSSFDSVATTTQCQHQMQHRTAGHLIIVRRLVIVHLFAGEDQTLLGRRNALLLFDSLLYSLDLIGWLDIDLDLFAGQSLSTAMREGDAVSSLASGGNRSARYIKIGGRSRRWRAEMNKKLKTKKEKAISDTMTTRADCRRRRQ